MNKRILLSILFIIILLIIISPDFTECFKPDDKLKYFIHNDEKNTNPILENLGIIPPYFSNEQLRNLANNYVIVMIAYNRPGYFSKTLSYLAKCDGIEKYTILFFIEPGTDNKEVIEIAKNFKDLQYRSKY